MSYALTVPLVLCLFLSRIVTSSSLPMLADPTDTCASTNRVMAEKQGGEAAAEEGKEKKGCQEDDWGEDEGDEETRMLWRRVRGVRLTSKGSDAMVR